MPRPSQHLRSYRFFQGLIALILLSALIVSARSFWTHTLQQLQLSRSYEPAPEGMVLVPAGEFIMGSDNPKAEPDETPARKVFLPAFYIDASEVTNRRYKEFKSNHPFPHGEEDLPVTGVLKSEAEAFCRWAGKRLPTSAEWEKAARGPDGRTYPWGDDFVPDRCNINTTTTAGDHATACTSRSTGRKLPPGSFPAGVSPYGCHDMSGNVWEWVSDEWIDRGIPLLSPPGEPRGILRGGAYGYSPFQARTSYQGFEHPDTTCNDVGFRCAQDGIPSLAP